MATVKTVGGLAWASVKTVGGLAKASIKTVGGLSAAASGMTTPLFAAQGTPSSVSASATEVFGFSASAPSCSSISSVVEQVCPINGTISKLYVSIDTAPGTGTSWTFKLNKNGSDTALSASISDSATTGSDTSNSVAVSAGDILIWSIIPANTPTLFTAISVSCILVSTTANESMVFSYATSLPNASTNYMGLILNTNSATEANASALVPAAGVLDKLYVRLSASPGAGKSYAFTVYHNGSPTSITCTVSDTNDSASDLSHTLTVAAGDTISMESIPSGTPTGRDASYSLRWVPTVANQAIVGFSGAAPSTSAAAYYLPRVGGGNGSASVTAALKGIVPCACTAKNMYVKMSTAAGASKSRTSALYINSGTGTIAAAVSGGSDTTGSDLVHTDSLSAGDYLTFVTTPAGTPAAVTNYKSAIVLTVP